MFEDLTSGVRSTSPSLPRVVIACGRVRISVAPPGCRALARSAHWSPLAGLRRRTPAPRRCRCKVAAEVGSDLRSQRETIIRARGNVREIGMNYGYAKQVIETPPLGRARLEQSPCGARCVCVPLAWELVGRQLWEVQLAFARLKPGARVVLICVRQTRLGLRRNSGPPRPTCVWNLVLGGCPQPAWPIGPKP